MEKTQKSFMEKKILNIVKKYIDDPDQAINARNDLLDLFIINNSCTNNKDLKPSGFGIVVDKSKSTKTFPLRGTPFPKGSRLNLNDQ